MKLNSIFRDRTVFQRRRPIRVWGESDQPVTVSLDGESVTVMPEDGRFFAELPPREAADGLTLCVKSGVEVITFTDLSVGEVVLCAGQSNMEFHMRDCNTSPAEWTTDPDLRMYNIQRPCGAEVLDQKNGWVPARADTVGNWTAIGYLTGRELRKMYGCTVGIISCSQGASLIQSWIDPARYEKCPIFASETERGYDPENPVGNWSYVFNRDGFLYREMLSELFCYSIGRVAWYQGESNAWAVDAALYGDLLALMVQNWREEFRYPELPFFIIQLADFSARTGEGAALWKRVQIEQAEAEKRIPYTVTVPCADICESDDIHPPTKIRLAERLAKMIFERS